jgi:hypothetical protein
MAFLLGGMDWHFVPLVVFMIWYSLLVGAFPASLPKIHHQIPRRTYKNIPSQCHVMWRPRGLLFKRMMNDNENHEPDNSSESEKKEVQSSYERASNLIRRFTYPVIDDPGLLLSDVLVAQVIGPSLQIAWISIQHAPRPSWLMPFFDTAVLYTKQGSYVAPALVHGAALASCWITGALASRAYERESISPVPMQRQDTLVDEQPKLEWDYSNVVLAIIKSGAFASGLLILATQIDLLLEFGRFVQLGESEDIDFRLIVASVEVINDIVFEALTLTAWRLFLAYQSEIMANE